MQNLLNELTELLSNDDRLVVEGKLLKNKIIELALAMDSELIKLLLNNKNIKKHFFADIEGILVFDKIKFQRFVSNKEFLPDSYTAFKNKIGLTNEQGDYITNSQEVVLAWPYKDCVLEGGQTKEDQKRDEIFWNETLAPDEIDRLLAPKVLTGWKRYDAKGKHELTGKEKVDFQNENLIIRGNNLLGLHSVYKQYAGRVKLIYIDPPYNTDRDEFKYNDSFSLSTWLTFMKCRLQIAKKILSDDGVIFIQISDRRLSELFQILKEIFEDNFINIISVETRSPSGFKTVNKGLFETAEYILCFGKNKKLWKYNTQYVVSTYDENYKYQINNIDEKPSKWKYTNIDQIVASSSGFSSPKEAKKALGVQVFINLLAKHALENSESVFRFTEVNDDAGNDTLLAKKQSLESRDKVFEVSRDEFDNRFILNGKEVYFYKNKLRNIDGVTTPTTLLTNIWTDIAWEGIANEGGVQLKKGKKPERLLRRIIDMSTSKGDLVLDFHLGSGTTCAVAHKMGRRYIGIEQLDYEDNDSVKRLQNVISNEQSGVSKLENWQGGGTFLYCELLEWNEAYISKIKKSETSKELIALWEEMQGKAFISYKIDPKTINDNIADFQELSIKDQKRFLIEILDKNQLYVNFSEIDDKDYKVSETDKKINSMFYGEA